MSDEVLVKRIRENHLAALDGRNAEYIADDMEKAADLIEQQAATIARLTAPLTDKEITSRYGIAFAYLFSEIIQERLNNG